MHSEIMKSVGELIQSGCQFEGEPSADEGGNFEDDRMQKRLAAMNAWNQDDDGDTDDEMPTLAPLNQLFMGDLGLKGNGIAQLTQIESRDTEQQREVGKLMEPVPAQIGFRDTEPEREVGKLAEPVPALAKPSPSTEPDLPESEGDRTTEPIAASCDRQPTQFPIPAHSDDTTNDNDITDEEEIDTDDIEVPPGLPKKHGNNKRQKKLTKNQLKNLRRRQRKAVANAQEEAEFEAHDCSTNFIGKTILTRGGRTGVIIKHDPMDESLTFKVMYNDPSQPTMDWLPNVDVFTSCGKDIYTERAYDCARFPESRKDQHTCETSPGRLEPPTGAMAGEPVLLPVVGRPDGAQEPSAMVQELEEKLRAKQADVDKLLAKLQELSEDQDPEHGGTLYDFFDDEGPGDRCGLQEIPGGIGVDSCASDNVMSKSHLKGFTIKPSAGSKRGQKWGSASGHTIPNEGECTYSFMTEHGDISRGTTQVGEVRRPLAAVSKITAAGNIAFFADGDDCIISRADPVVKEILALVRKATKKTKVHQYKGTYRMRAWMIPEGAQGKVKKPDVKGSSRPFGRPGR